MIIVSFNTDKPENTIFQILTASVPGTTLKDLDVTLQCSADGYPAPEISLYNSTSLLQKANHGNLIIRTVKNHQEGEYRCLASNTVGNGTVIVKNLTVNGK